MAVTHFGELFGQLVDNAFKFSTPGRGVRIHLDLLPGEACELTVRDRT
jgi:signal transduction histidine kinase